MIIYEVTNKYKTIDDLIFSKYYPTKDQALDNTASNLECYKLELNSLGREEIASILSMEHVKITQTQKGYHEMHEISNITKTKEKIQ